MLALSWSKPKTLYTLAQSMFDRLDDLCFEYGHSVLIVLEARIFRFDILSSRFLVSSQQQAVLA